MSTLFLKSFFILQALVVQNLKKTIFKNNISKFENFRNFAIFLIPGHFRSSKNKEARGGISDIFASFDKQ